MSKDRTIISFDYAIKTVLRDKANFDILEGFLSELLERKVTVHGILESESNKRLKSGKTNKVDLKAQIDDGEFAIFEIQFADQVDFFGKILFASSKAIVEQVGSGDKYDIKKVYSINIAYFDLGAKQEYLFHADLMSFKGIHYKEEIPFAQNENLAPPPAPPKTASKKYIHPEYYLILPNIFGEKIKSRFDEWMYTLKNSVVKKEFKAAGLQEAGVKLDELKMTKAQRAAYEKYLTERQSVDCAIWTAEVKGEARGKAEGIEIGKAEGKVEGIEEGIGIGEERKNLENAKAMKAEGLDIDTIARITGLSADVIQRL